MFCPKCGVKNPDARTNCGACGETLPGGGLQPAVATGRSCPYCGVPNPPARAICGACGRPMSIASNVGSATGGASIPCPSCGQANPAVRTSCGACGVSLLSSPSVVAASSQTVSYSVAGGQEQVIGVLPGLYRQKGFMQRESFSAVVTDRRIIFALSTQEMIKEESRQRWEESKKKGGGGWASGLWDSMTIGANFHKRYLGISPDIALSENPGNFFIDRSQVKWIKAGLGALRHHDHHSGATFTFGHADREDGKVEIELQKGHFTFGLSASHYEEARTTLRQAGIPG